MVEIRLYRTALQHFVIESLTVSGLAVHLNATTTAARAIAKAIA